MRTIIVFLFLFLRITLFAQLPEFKKPIKHHEDVNRNKILSLCGNPIDFYLNHIKIDSYSKMFFRGELSMSNDPIIVSIMDSVLTNNSETRPFYFFVFNQIVELSDGRRIEPVSSRCLEFVEKYPCEFFNSFNQADVNINVVKWTTFIGLALKDKNQYADFKNTVDSKFRAGCSEEQDIWKSFLTEVRMCLVR